MEDALATKLRGVGPCPFQDDFAIYKDIGLKVNENILRMMIHDFGHIEES